MKEFKIGERVTLEITESEKCKLLLYMLALLSLMKRQR